MSVPLSSATVHEAGGRVGALPSAIKPLDQTMRLVAPAFPVRTPPGDNLWLHRAVCAASRGDVLVVDTGAGFEYGYWGEILAEAAIARGLAGLVIHGGVRDSRRLIELGWPVFAERVCISGTAKDPAGPGALGEPITIGNVPIRRGDLIVADADGVVRIPSARVEDVLTLSARREQDEADHIRRIRDGETTMAIYKLP